MEEYILKKGVTLVELICTIAVLSVIFLISYPFMKNYMKNNTLKISADRLVNDLRYAKIYAMADKRASVQILFNQKQEDGYNGYLIIDGNRMKDMKLKEVKLPRGIIIWKGSTFSEDKIAFGNKGNIVPHACTIVLRDVETMKEKRITLTIDFSRIMVVE